MNKPKFEAAVGLFVAVGFVILSLIIFFVSGVYFFRPGYHLRAVFDYVGIINRGAPVRFSGVRVGEVSQVNILTSTQANDKMKVELTFFVEKGVVIRENYPIGIRGTHIMSEPHIEITPMPGEGRVLHDGDLVAGVSPYSTDELIEQFNSAAEKANKILEHAGQVFEDPEMRRMLRDSLKNMNQLLASMSAITVGQEKEFRQMIEHLNYTADQMGQLLERINNGQGTLGKLVTQDEIYNDFRDFVRDIKARPWRLLKK